MLLRDRLILLLTGLVAIYLLWRFLSRYLKDKKRHDIYYMISFAVLLVAGLLLIIFTYRALANPLVVVVAVLIPAALALGLISQFFPRYEIPYLIFTLVGLVVIAITRFTAADPDNPGALATIPLVIVHALSGLIILVLPFVAAAQKMTRWAFISVSVGGLLIDVGGVALAFLRSGNQLLFFSWDVIAIVLAPLLLLMALAFAYGFVRDIQWKKA